MNPAHGSPHLGDLEELVEELRQRSQPVADEETVRALLQTADTLSSRDLGDYPRQTDLLYETADLALRSAAELSTADELHLLAHLETDLPGDDGFPGWPQARRERSRRWLAALRRLDDQVDPVFDPRDTPAMNVLAPEGLPAGVAADRVRDPELRRQYEADLEANRAKAERFAQQWQARQLLDLYEPRAARYLGHAYRTSRAAREELEQLLDEQGVPEARKSQIREAAGDADREQNG